MQLGWAHKLVGAESLGSSKAGQTVLARLMESQIWHQSASSVREKAQKGRMASAHLEARYLSLSLHATGAPQATTPSLEPKGSEPE